MLSLATYREEFDVVNAYFGVSGKGLANVRTTGRTGLIFDLHRGVVDIEFFLQATGDEVERSVRLGRAVQAGVQGHDGLTGHAAS